LFGSTDDPLLLASGRDSQTIHLAAKFDLDKADGVSSSGDKINFARCAFPPPGQNLMPADQQLDHDDDFGHAARPLGTAAIRIWPMRRGGVLPVQWLSVLFSVRGISFAISNASR
jgi:hypothetical protein